MLFPALINAANIFDGAILYVVTGILGLLALGGKVFYKRAKKDRCIIDTMEQMIKNDKRAEYIAMIHENAAAINELSKNLLDIMDDLELKRNDNVEIMHALISLQDAVTPFGGSDAGKKRLQNYLIEREV